MEQLSNIKELLELMTQPAFWVQSGVISYVNQAAANYMITPGTPVADILAGGSEEYAAFQGGCLYLTLRIDTQSYGASVTRIDGQDIFRLDSFSDTPELQSMALAAQALRDPLTNLMVCVNRLLPNLNSKEDPAAQQQAAHINQSLHQMLRLIGNMSDAARYTAEAPLRYVCRDICAILQEIFDKASALSEQTGVTLCFENYPEAISCMIDEERLERAVYNLISNAMKFTPAGGTIRAKLTRRENRLMFTVEDTGSGIPAHLRNNVFSRYLRQPNIEEGRQGIGLGMVMVRAAAAAHGGTVLIDQSEEKGTRVTMTLTIRKPNSANFRSPQLNVDYAGEYDHCLTELAEILPVDVYCNK